MSHLASPPVVQLLSLPKKGQLSAAGLPDITGCVGGDGVLSNAVLRCTLMMLSACSDSLIYTTRYCGLSLNDGWGKKHAQDSTKWLTHFRIGHNIPLVCFGMNYKAPMNGISSDDSRAFVLWGFSDFYELSLARGICRLGFAAKALKKCFKGFQVKWKRTDWKARWQRFLPESLPNFYEKKKGKKTG